MPSVQSTILLTTTLLGSVIQHAAAAPEARSVKRTDVNMPECITTCLRSSGCFDAQCVCQKADQGLLNDIIVCMSQSCPTDVTAKNLIGVVSAQCDLSGSALSDSDLRGGIHANVNVNDDEDSGSVGQSQPAMNGPKKNDESDDTDPAVFTTFDLAPPLTFAPKPTQTKTVDIISVETGSSSASDDDNESSPATETSTPTKQTADASSSLATATATASATATSEPAKETPTESSSADVTATSVVSVTPVASSTDVADLPGKTIIGTETIDTAMSTSTNAPPGLVVSANPTTTMTFTVSGTMATASASATPSSSSDDKGNGAGMTSQTSVFGVVVAMGFALVMGL